MTLWQAMAQSVSDPTTRSFLSGFLAAGGVILALFGLLYRGFVAWMKKLITELEAIGQRQQKHEAADDARFSDVVNNATRRHEELMGAVQRHADAITAPLSQNALDIAKERLRVDALFEMDERRRTDTGERK